MNGEGITYVKLEKGCLYIHSEIGIRCTCTIYQINHIH